MPEDNLSEQEQREYDLHMKDECDRDCVFCEYEYEKQEAERQHFERLSREGSGNE